MAGADWSVDEVEAIVGDYFEMLRAELASKPHSKTAHRRAFVHRLNQLPPEVEARPDLFSAIRNRSV